MNLSFPFVADFSPNFAHAQEQATLSTSKVTAAIWSYGHCSSYSEFVLLYKQGGTSKLLIHLNCTLVLMTEKAAAQGGSQDFQMKIETFQRHPVAVTRGETLREKTF